MSKVKTERHASPVGEPMDPELIAFLQQFDDQSLLNQRVAKQFGVADENRYPDITLGELVKSMKSVPTEQCADLMIFRLSQKLNLIIP